MTSSSTLQDLFESEVFEDTDILAISPKAYGYAVTEDSEFEIENLYHNKQINFFQYLVARGVRFNESAAGIGSTARYNYVVEISYFRAKDTDGDNWLAVRDAFDTLFETIRTELGTTWDELVDGWAPQEGPAEIVEVRLGQEQVWRGTYRFTAFKQVSF